jgi:1,4-alpha-glucan branching enzyme
LFRDERIADAARMQHEQTFAGELVQYEKPQWDPLIDFVGPHLVRWFMWMHEFAVDGVRAHAYKHCATRRYLHIAEDGRVFGCVPRYRYRVLERAEALEDVFSGWEETIPEPDEPARAALERLRRAAA